MYEHYYNLRERPFSLSPDPEYLYPSRVHREALDSLRYGIESRAGFIVVTGEIGAGKTTLLQTLLRELDERTIVGRLVNTMLDPNELLESIALEFGLDVIGKSKPLLLRDLGQFLVEARNQGRRPLLIIDEAQNLGARGLEEVRLLSNLETEKSKLLQMVFVGQPGLRALIGAPDLIQFRQRVAVSYHLAPMAPHETAAYIEFRLNRAAAGVPPRFAPDASALVHEVSEGVPRLINVVCDGTLILGYAEDRPQIDISLVREAVAELHASRLLPVHSNQPARSGRAAAQAVGSPQFVQSSTLVSATLPVGGGLEASARAAAELTAQTARLAERERAIAQREQELTEQRRALEAEVRAFRGLHARPGPATGATMTSELPRVDPVAQSAAGLSPAVSWFEGIRRRVRRALSEPEQTVEHN